MATLRWHSLPSTKKTRKLKFTKLSKIVTSKFLIFWIKIRAQTSIVKMPDDVYCVLVQRYSKVEKIDFSKFSRSLLTQLAAISQDQTLEDLINEITDDEALSIFPLEEFMKRFRIVLKHHIDVELNACKTEFKETMTKKVKSLLFQRFVSSNSDNSNEK